MKVISSHAVDTFFFFVCHDTSEIEGEVKPIKVGDFEYYDCNEIMKHLPIVAKTKFRLLMQRNPFEVHEITIKHIEQ